MSAAPDLLEVIKLVLNDRYFSHLDPTTQDRVRAAITKAITDGDADALEESAETAMVRG